MLQVKVGNKSINSSYLGFVTLLFLFWCDRTILSYVKGVIGSNEILLSFYDITIVIVMIICWLLVLKDIVSGFSIIDIVITCFFVGFYILAIYDYNAREYALENSYRFLCLFFRYFF